MDVFVTFLFYLGEAAGLYLVSCGKFEDPDENAEVVYVVCDTPARGQFVKIQKTVIVIKHTS